MASVVALLQKNNIPAKDYSTSSFSIQSQYDYSSGERVFTGYKASQSLTVTLRSLTQDGA
ncbi:MAG: DUF541 domain-containing protein [Neisseriales bacterium]|nr:MAG: DUF541 domain-containing protein [Neisseriales bacterium]